MGLLLLWKGGAPQVGLPGKEGHLKRDCPQASKPSPAPVSSAKDHTGRETAPRGVGFQVGLSRQSGLKVPTQAPVLITPEEPWVLIAVGGPIRQFPFRYWGHLLRAY